MGKDLIVRFVIGGLVVSGFALLGDLLKPKTFAGLFGAAPSVALASLALTAARQGTTYASVQSRSMLLGGVAFFIYANCICHLMLKGKRSANAVSLPLLLLWLAAALGLYFAFRGVWS